jgi:hypothetical protein
MEQTKAVFKPMMAKKKEKAYDRRNRRDSGDIMREYKAQKKKARVAFEEIQTTGEYMETHYFKQTSYAQSQGLNQVNAFWYDYACYLLDRAEDRGKQFLSPNFTRNSDN